MGHAFADWAEKVMLGLDEYIVPVKRLWNLHCEQNEIPKFTPEQLGQILKEDPRFYFVEDPAETWEESEDEVARLEKMGFFKGPKVMLQGRIPSKQELIDAIAGNIDKMMQNLRKAYEIRPKDSDETEDELIDLMLKADQLKKEILKAMSDEMDRVENMEKSRNTGNSLNDSESSTSS